MVGIHGTVAKVIDLKTAGSSHRQDYVKRVPKPHSKFDAAFKQDAVVVQKTPKKHHSSKTPSPSAAVRNKDKRQLYANSSDDEDKVYFSNGMFSTISVLTFLTYYVFSPRV